MATKRGTNQIHGSAYWFYFDTAVGAANTLERQPHARDRQRRLPMDTRPSFPTTATGLAALSAARSLPKNFLGGKWYGFFNYEALRFPNAAFLLRKRALRAVESRHYPGAKCARRLHTVSISTRLR